MSQHVKFTACGFFLCLALIQTLSNAAARPLILHLHHPENTVTSLLIDQASGMLYAATAEADFRYSLETSSAHVVRIRLTDFSRRGHLTLAAGDNPLSVGFLDAANRLLYFGTYGDPHKGKASKLLKIRLSDFKQINAIDLGNNEYGVSSAIFDSQRNVGVLGTLFGNIVGVGLEKMIPQGSLGLEREENAFQSAVIDGSNTFAYFGTSTGNILKVQLSEFNPSDTLAVLRGEKGFSCAAIDPQGKFAYFGTQGSPAKVVRISLPSFGAPRVLTLEAGEGQLVSAAIDSTSGISYFVSSEGKARLIRVRLDDFSRIDSVALPPQSNPLGCAAIDVAHKSLYIGTRGHPAAVLKIPFGE